jgi:GNAT superfamily N-acetyltransferase
MGSVSTEESTPATRVKSVFCFAIAPEMRRKGIAKLLLERVCQDADQDGFDSVEAYPKKVFTSEAEDFVGPAEVYRKSGFTVHHETDRQLVMRKQLK